MVTKIKNNHPMAIEFIRCHQTTTKIVISHPMATKIITSCPMVIEFMDAPQNRRFYGKMDHLPLWPNYISEKGETLGKTYGIKTKCCWEHPWGTHWEPMGNILGT